MPSETALRGREILDMMMREALGQTMADKSAAASIHLNRQNLRLEAGQGIGGEKSPS